MGIGRSVVVFIVLAMLAVSSACGNGTNPLPAPDVAPEDGEIHIGPGEVDVPPRDIPSGPFCTVSWSWKSTGGSGATSHLARDKYGLLYASSYAKLYALGDAGKEEWVWPDDDALESPVAPVDAQLGTPSIGQEGRIFMGTAGEAGWQDNPDLSPPQVICLNKGGSGRWAFDATGPVLAAPTILLDGDIMALTEDGTLYKLHDFQQDKVFRRWSLPKEPAPGAHAFDPLPGVQVLADEREGVEPVAWVLGVDSVSLVHWWTEPFGETVVEVGGIAWTVPLPADMEATSNPVLDADGVFHFGAGVHWQADGTYEDITILSLDRDGTWVTGAEGVQPALGSTAITGLTEGLGDTWIVGTSNNGVAILFAATGEVLARHFENFWDVPAPVQTADKHVFSSSLPHWIHVMGVDGEVLWTLDLEDSVAGVTEVELAPSSPLVGADGTVYVHAGNTVVALICTGAPPAAVTWPRHGGNDRNTGNLAHNLTD